MTAALLALPPVNKQADGTWHTLLTGHGTVLYVGLAVVVVGLADAVD